MGGAIGGRRPAYPPLRAGPPAGLGSTLPRNAGVAPCAGRTHTEGPGEGDGAVICGREKRRGATCILEWERRQGEGRMHK